jgi:hypothetical protein
MSRSTIMVQMAETKWTTSALEVAAAKARETGAEVVLAYLIPCECLKWGGLAVEEHVFSESERDDLQTYQAIATRYGVRLSVRKFEYENLEAGLIAAADVLSADEVFAPVPHSALPFLSDRQARHLSHALEAHRHHLYTVDQPAVTVGWKPEAHIVSE